MKKITLLMLLTAFALFANAQLQLNTAPFALSDHRLNAGINVDTLRNCPPIDGITTSEVWDIDFTWHWTPSKVGNWSLDATDVTTGCRTTGAPTVVNSFYHWAGIPDADAASYPNAAPAGEYLFSPQTVSTRDGFVARIKSKDGTIQDVARNPASQFSQTQSGFFSLGGNMNGGGDPVWFASIADMMTYMKSGMKVLSDNTYQNNKMNGNDPRSDYGSLHEGLHTHVTNADFPNGLNTADSALVVVLPKDGNEALSIYPGIFKEIDMRFSFRSDRQQWTRDITFDISTLDPGNTGKTADWDVIISLTYNNLAPNPERDNTDSLQLGDNGTIVGGYRFANPINTLDTIQVGRRWKAATYTTGSAPVTINVNKVMGLKPYELFNRTIVIALQTKGTEGETDNPSGTYDPIIAIDNIKWGGWNVQLDAATWAAQGPLLPLREEGEPEGRAWDFTSWSAETLANLAADPTNWNPASTTRYNNIPVIPADMPIVANGVEIKELKDLTFNQLNGDRLRIDYGTDSNQSRISLNAANISVNVPNCKAGEIIKIAFRTTTDGSARGLTPTNATGDDTQSSSSSDDPITNTYIVTADGTATFTTTAGLQIFKITASGNGLITSIPKITHEAKVVIRSEYFDLTGRRVNANTKGFLIQKMYYEDGTTGSKKLFVYY